MCASLIRSRARDPSMWSGRPARCRISTWIGKSRSAPFSSSASASSAGSFASINAAPASPIAPCNMATLEERTDDIRAVMDDVGIKSANIFGVSEGGSMACLFAATYPERVESLLIWGAQARWIATRRSPLGADAGRSMKKCSQWLQDDWPSIAYIVGPGAGMGTDAPTRSGRSGRSLHARGGESFGGLCLRGDEWSDRYAADSADDSGAYLGDESHGRPVRSDRSCARHGLADSGRKIQRVSWQQSLRHARRHGSRAVRYPGIHHR